MARQPIFNATLQAALLGAVSNVLAQLITANRNKVRTSKPIALFVCCLSLAFGVGNRRGRYYKLPAS